MQGGVVVQRFYDTRGCKGAIANPYTKGNEAVHVTSIRRGWSSVHGMSGLCTTLDITPGGMGSGRVSLFQAWQAVDDGARWRSVQEMCPCADCRCVCTVQGIFTTTPDELHADVDTCSTTTCATFTPQQFTLQPQPSFDRDVLPSLPGCILSRRCTHDTM